MANAGGVWRTISGRRVFIRNGQSLTDAMRESGKFDNNEYGSGENETFNRAMFQSGKDLTKDIVGDSDFQYYGLRVQEYDTEKLGEEMTHTSQNWGEDFEGQEEEYEELNGVSTIGINNIYQVTETGGYSGKVMYLLGSNDREYGYDPGENILREPTVLAKMKVQEGKLALVESVGVRKLSNLKQESMSNKTASSKSVYAGTKTQVQEYISFKFEMEKKYGEHLWAEMSDNEYDRLERLERVAYRGS